MGAVFLSFSDSGTLDGTCPDLFKAGLAAVVLGIIHLLGNVAITMAIICDGSSSSMGITLERDGSYCTWVKVVAVCGVFMVGTPLTVLLALGIRSIVKEDCYDNSDNPELMWWTVAPWGLGIVYFLLNCMINVTTRCIHSLCDNCFGCCKKPQPQPRVQP